MSSGKHDITDSYITELLLKSCSYTGLGPDLIIGKGRKREYVDVRQAISIICFHDGFSYEAIGNSLGGKDHSSIYHLVNERKLTERSLNIMNYLLKDKNHERISILAEELSKNPANGLTRKKLKEML